MEVPLLMETTIYGSHKATTHSQTVTAKMAIVSQLLHIPSIPPARADGCGPLRATG